MTEQVYCGAKGKRGGGPCKRTAGAGTDHPGFGHCYLHGGRTENGAVYAAKLEAAHELQVMGVATPIEPHEAILKCLAIAHGEVNVATKMIERLKPSQVWVAPKGTVERPLNLGKEGEDPSITVEETRTDPLVLHQWIRMRHDAMDRVVRYSVAASRAKVEERLVRVAEQQAVLFATAVRNILERLGVANRPEAPGIVRQELLAIAAPETELPDIVDP